MEWMRGAGIRGPLRIGLARLILLACLAATSAQAQIGGCTPDFSDPIQVSVETSVGEMILELYPNMAPGTVANFLAYMSRGDYDGAIFHRSVPGFVIQGGGFRETAGAYESIPTDPPILNEPCLSNTAGTIAMARLGGQPDSATNQWFVNLEDNLFLDATDGVGFTAFGRVVFGGMDVANTIAALPIEDTLGILELPFNQIFRALPLQSPTAEPPGGYGCARTSPVHGLLSETADFLIVDPLRHGGTLVPILLDPACTGAGANGPPTVPCTPENGREVAIGTLETGAYFLPRVAMTCEQVAESEASWAARRAGTAPQYLDLDVEMIAVPEPEGPQPLLALVVSFFVLGRWCGAQRRSLRSRSFVCRR
jgi:cyclophilin family peptidyl-prolyl cis-trans isomerase